MQKREKIKSFYALTRNKSGEDAAALCLIEGVVKDWDYKGRTLILHKSVGDDPFTHYSVSDYVTGRLLFRHKYKAVAIRNAESIVDKFPAIDTQEWKEFLSKNYEVNTHTFLMGWKEGVELILRNDNYANGIKIAFANSDKILSGEIK